MAGSTSLQIATLVVAGYAAVGTTVAAVVAGVQARLTVRRTWLLEGVTERYTAFLDAFAAYVDVYMSVVQSVYATTPVGDVQAAWDALNGAQGEMIRKAAQAQIVARPAASQLMRHAMAIDSTLLCPLALPTGAPPIATDLQRRQLAYVTALYGHTTNAMRIDLGLMSRKGRRAFERGTADLPKLAPTSASKVDDVEHLRNVLSQYNVGPMGGAAADFRMPGQEMSRYQLALAGLRQPIGAMFCSNGFTLNAAVHDPLSPGEEMEVLQAMVRFVESGLRDGPDTRDAPWGGRVAVWPRRVP